MNASRIIVLVLISSIVLVGLLPFVASSSGGLAGDLLVASLWDRVRPAPPAHGIALTVQIVERGSGRVIATDNAGRVIANHPYASLQLLARLLDGTIKWDGRSRVVTIETGRTVSEAAGRITYRLDRATEPDNWLVFTVSNAGRDQQLEFAGGMSWDLAIYRDNVEIWRLSDGQHYTMQLRRQVFRAGDALTYMAELPELDAGKYRAVAWFAGVEDRGPHARMEFEIERSQIGRGLEFELNLPARIAATASVEAELTVSNPTRSAITVELPTSQTHDFVLVRDGRVIWRHSDEQSYLQVQTRDRIGAGQERRISVELPQLARGTYRLDAYFWGSRIPVAGTEFQVR